MKVLFGFKHEPTERAIRNYLESYGQEIDGKTRYTKKTIEDVIRKEPDLDIVYVKEFLEGGEKYSAQEISALCDISTARFIVIVNPSERGTDTMRTLYCAGVLDACYADRRHGAKAQLLASLAMKGRKRLEAREYYRIDDALPDYGALSYQEYQDSYAFFKGSSGDGGRMIDHFIDLSKMLSPKQYGKFIDTLSENDLAGLLPYVEFYDILETLRQNGVIVPHYKKPKDAQKALDEKTVKKAKTAKTEVKLKKETPVQIKAVHTDIRDIEEVEAHYGGAQQGAPASAESLNRKGSHPSMPAQRQVGRETPKGPQRAGNSLHGKPPVGQPSKQRPMHREQPASNPIVRENSNGRKQAPQSRGSQPAMSSAGRGNRPAARRPADDDRRMAPETSFKAQNGQRQPVQQGNPAPRRQNERTVSVRQNDKSQENGRLSSSDVDKLLSQYK